MHHGTLHRVSSQLGKTVCEIAARKLVNRALQSRKTSAVFGASITASIDV